MRQSDSQCAILIQNIKVAHFLVLWRTANNIKIAQ